MFPWKSEQFTIFSGLNKINSPEDRAKNIDNLLEQQKKKMACNQNLGYL